MLLKKKLCKCGCGQHGYIYARGMLLNCYKREFPHKFKVRPESIKGKSRRIRYNEINKEFKAKNSRCMAKLAGCTKLTTQTHHMKGRTGDLLFDTAYFLPVCDNCHRWIEEHPSQAKEMGFSFTRV